MANLSPRLVSGIHMLRADSNHVKRFFGVGFMSKFMKLSAILLTSIMLGGVTLETTSSFSNDTFVSAASKKSKKATAKRKRVNKLIDAVIKQDQGIANGLVDEDGNSVDNGTPNPDYAWALTIDSVTYRKDGELLIRVNNQFNNLSKSDKTQALRYAQSEAFTVLGDNYKKWADSYDRPRVTAQDSTGVFIATSKVSDPGKFKFFE